MKTAIKVVRWVLAGAFFLMAALIMLAGVEAWVLAPLVAVFGVIAMPKPYLTTKNAVILGIVAVVISPFVGSGLQYIDPVYRAAQAEVRALEQKEKAAEQEAREAAQAENERILAERNARLEAEEAEREALSDAHGLAMFICQEAIKRSVRYPSELEWMDKTLGVVLPERKGYLDNGQYYVTYRFKAMNGFGAKLPTLAGCYFNIDEEHNVDFVDIKIQE